MTIETSTLAARAAELLIYDAQVAINAPTVAAALIAEYNITPQRAKIAIAHAARQHRGQPDHIRPSRQYNPEWADNTRNQRQANRNQALNQAAQDAGWGSWSAFSTAVLKGEIALPRR